MSISERAIIRSAEREPTQSTYVLKFGGTSIGSAEAIERAAEIIYDHRKMGSLVVVVSAMEGVTNGLRSICRHLGDANTERAEAIVYELRRRHIAVCARLQMSSLCRLDIEDEISCLFDELSKEIKAEEPFTPVKEDSILSYGERASTRIVGARLRMLMPIRILDSSELIQTDDTFGNARPQLEETRLRVGSAISHLLQRGVTPVVTGFIGATADGRITTLGPNSSDYVAALIGAGIGAKEVSFWKTVDGVYSDDPKRNSDVVFVPQMTHDEYLTNHSGSRVLDKRAAQLLQYHAIPCRVKNTNNPSGGGTLIVS